MQRCIFSIITPVFIVTWLFRNHSNILSCCSRNIYYYQLSMFFFMFVVSLIHVFRILWWITHLYSEWLWIYDDAMIKGTDIITHKPAGPAEDGCSSCWVYVGWKHPERRTPPDISHIYEYPHLRGSTKILISLQFDRSCRLQKYLRSTKQRMK